MLKNRKETHYYMHTKTRSRKIYLKNILKFNNNLKRKDNKNFLNILTQLMLNVYSIIPHSKQKWRKMRRKQASLFYVSSQIHKN